MPEISDQELRALVRDSIARHAAEAGSSQLSQQPLTAGRAHPSHLKFLLPAGGDGDGMCVIEPAVRCTHCGYCQSYGH
ncbi:MAG TPA: hypothetical protein VKB36_11880 [Vicinamibacterales bacterium]|nr:hypothetical protein [Vicinamibacterales bacterium]